MMLRPPVFGPGFAGAWIAHLFAPLFELLSRIAMLWGRIFPHELAGFGDPAHRRSRTAAPTPIESPTRVPQ